jgi:hypothetical protein
MQLQAVGLKAFAVLLAVLAIGPVVAGAAIHRQTGTADHWAFWAIMAIAVLTFGVMGFSMLNRSATLQDQEFKVKSTFYSTTVPVTRITDARTVARGSEGDVVRLRVNGVALPGLESGWFDSRAGGRLFVDRVAGDYLLVSVDGKPRLALEFTDNDAVARSLAAAMKAREARQPRRPDAR